MRSARDARDALGRPVEAGDPTAVPPVAEGPRSPEEALRLVRALLAVGRAFSAHEVCEGVWKECGPTDRPLWQGLAQVCVALTHLQRGNPVGASRLLARGAGHLACYSGPAYPARALADRALGLSHSLPDDFEDARDGLAV